MLLVSPDFTGWSLIAALVNTVDDMAEVAGRGQGTLHSSLGLFGLVCDLGDAGDT